MDLTPYIETARRRRQQEQEQLQQRRQQALRTAQAAAQLLREKFGARKVWGKPCGDFRLWFG